MNRDSDNSSLLCGEAQVWETMKRVFSEAGGGCLLIFPQCFPLLGDVEKEFSYDSPSWCAYEGVIVPGIKLSHRQHSGASESALIHRQI